MQIKGRYIIFYYAVLMLVMMSWTDYNSFPSMILRIVFLIAVMVPGFFDKDCVLPAAITCFWGVAVNGYAYSYMPTQVYLYVGLLLVSMVIINRYDKKSMMFRGYLLPVCLFLFVTLRNLIQTTSIEEITWGLLIFILFPYFIPDKGNDNEKKMSWAFMVMTIVLSFYSLTTQELFAAGAGASIADRSAWTDPNYLSMIVGMGAVIGFRNILRIRNIDRFTAVLSLISFFMAVPAMLLLVSRGGLLCLCGGIAVLMLFSKIKTSYKIGVIVFIVIFVIILYTNDFLTMLEERLNGEANASNNERVWILQNRLTAFFEGSPFYWLVGYGLQDGLKLGLPFPMGSHNDYVAFLAEYGVIGLVMFLGMLSLPFYNMKHGTKVLGEVCAYTFYLLLASLTLEPFAFGRWVYYVFLLFIIIIVRNDNVLQRKRMIKNKIVPVVEDKLKIDIKEV